MDENPRSPGAEYDIVHLGAEHIDELVRLERECFTDPWTQEQFVQLLSNPLAVYVVAVSDKDGVIGYAGMYHILSEGQLMNIATRREYRRRGVAQSLFEKLLEYAEENDIDTVTLEVRASNEAAIAFYEKLGFEETGSRRGYYSRPNEDAVLMTLKL